MSDLFFKTERAYKELMKLWNQEVGHLHPKSNKHQHVSISYQRYKILKAIGEGADFTPDIVILTGVDISTASHMLLQMLDGGLTQRTLHESDYKAYRWSLTEDGESRVRELSDLHARLLPTAEAIIGHTMA